jgi:crotonobetainyl-CoA:carnitine CoA-transferase CaiB-like acyl-CoA transferase
MGFDAAQFNYMIEQVNRGKRSICLDLKSPDGLAVLMRLVAQADVFLTSMLEPPRRRLGVTYDDLKEVNPRIIYARGHGYGQHGDEADTGGIETVAFFARTGLAHELTEPGGPLARFPQGTGDITSGMYLAGGIAAALYRRTVTGRGGLVDVSLLGSAAWTMSLEVVAQHFFGSPPRPSRDVPVAAPANALLGNYRTSDDRIIVLGMVTPDRYWNDFRDTLGIEDAVGAYDTFEQRAGNEDLYRLIMDTFASQPLAVWRERLGNSRCIWSVVQTPQELAVDRQAVVNGYTVEHPTIEGARLIASPVQYQDEVVEITKGAPAAGEHTEEILQELGFDRTDIERLVAAGAVSSA